eukprot:545900_1
MLGWIVLIIILLYLLTRLDADIITYLHHLYRLKFDPKCFKGKTIWIVGSSSGIGEYVTYELVKCGAKTIIISSRRTNELERVKKQCESIGNCEIIVSVLDLVNCATKETFVSEYIDKLYTKNSIDDIDILIINSGRNMRAKLPAITMEGIRNILNVNLLGHISLIKTMTQKWIDYNDSNDLNKNHQIVVTSSLMSKFGMPELSLYAMCRWGINGFIESIRIEHTLDDIDMCLILPGPVENDDKSNVLMNGDGSGGLSRSELQKKMKDLGNVMTRKRCAELYVTAVRYKIAESWVSIPSVLILTYIRQYAPFIVSSRIVRTLIAKKAKKNSIS